MEIVIKCNRPEVITDLIKGLQSITIMNDMLLSNESVHDIDIHYEKNIVIINLE